MKSKFFLPIFLSLFLSSIHAQNNSWQGGSFFSVEQMRLNYTLTDNFDEASSNPVSIHASIGFRLERKWKERWLIQSGIGFSKMKFNPEMYLPWSYGTVFKIGESEEILFSPILHQQEINVFSIPLGLKYNFAPNRKWQPFLSLAVNSSIKYHEKEIYQEGFDDFNGERKTLPVKDPGIDLFNVGFDLETGIQFQVNSFFKIVLAPGIRIAEYRNENEKFKKNGEFLYQKEWLSWTQKKIGVGFLASF